MKCIYCKSSLSTENRSYEHILPAALGWDQGIPLVCKSCNVRFGSTLDAALAHHLEPLRIHFKVADREGDAPKAKAAAETGPWASKKVSYTPETIVLPSNVIPTGEGEFRSYGSFEPDDLEVKLQQRRGQGHLEKISEGSEEITLSTDNPLAFLSDPLALRSVVKTLVNYLAFSLETSATSFLFEPVLDHVRSFVVGDSSVHHDQLSIPVSSPQVEIPRHSILVGMDGEIGVVHGLLSLFDVITIYGLLTQDYHGADRWFGTIIDPKARCAETLRNSRDKIRDCLGCARKIFDCGQESRGKLNYYKVRLLSDTIQGLNHYCRKAGINLEIKARED